MISMCARVRFFALIIRRSQNTRFLCRTHLRFFALMTHKSVTCARFPNKPGVPLTEKIKYTCTFFGDGIYQLSFFSHTSILRASSVLCVFPAQVSSFAPKFSLGTRFQNLFLQPHPLSLSIPPPSRPPLPASQTAAAATTASTTSTFYLDQVR